jgi:uncharacterized C2H2 Zn-finger protein
MFSNEKNSKKLIKYICESCDFITCNKNDYTRHINTIKHKNLVSQCFSIEKTQKNSYSFTLSKSAGRINGKCCHCPYEKGDNDFYWLNCKNGYFYVIPEDVLIEKGYVGKDSKKEHLYVSHTNQNTEWCDDYLFKYENLDVDGLLEIFE